MTLGERIQSLRKEAGLSQEELGDKLGVARQSVSKWESDTTIPELDKLIAMSRLFHISVGALLGIEESEGADHELTDRELAALEEIARKLAQTRQEASPQEGPTKKKGRRGALVAVTLIAAGITLMLTSRINRLENQLGSLHYNISNIQNTVSREIGSISSQVRDILEEQNSVTAGKSYEIVDMDLLDNTVTFALIATPREYKEGMRAVFSATGPDFETVEVPGTLGAGQTFTAELTCPLTDDITLSVGFESEGTIVTQQLGVENYLLSDTQVIVDGSMGWSGSGLGEKFTFSNMDASVWPGSVGWYKTREGAREIKVVKVILHLWTGDTLYWSQEFEQSGHYHGEIPIEDLTVKPGERVILSCLYTDSAGREDEVFLDGVVVNEEGSPDRLAPYDKDWEGNYPWE